MLEIRHTAFRIKSDNRVIILCFFLQNETLIQKFKSDFTFDTRILLFFFCNLNMLLNNISPETPERQSKDVYKQKLIGAK